MATFTYKAKSLQGETHTGIKSAKDKKELAKSLRAEGYVLISAQIREEKKKKTSNISISIPFLNPVLLTDKMFFTKNLQVMVASGVPLPQGLKTLSVASKNQKFGKVLLEIKNEIIKGESFSKALFKYPKFFSELFANMVKVGEEAGTLDKVLGILAKQMEKDHNLRSKIKGALIYPSVIIIAMLGVGILMLATVVPKLADTFNELNIELPTTTKFVIFMGTFLAEKWYIVILIFAVLVFLGMTVLKTKKGGIMLSRVLLKLPIIAPLVKKTNCAYTARTLSSLIASGVPLVRNLDITSGAVTNFYYKKALKEMADKVRKGEKLSSAMSEYENLYPVIIIQMLKVGEETGETSSVLEKIADFFEQEVTDSARNLSAVIEPVLMLIIGAAVGFFAISMVQPMYSMLEAI
ncbi:type II secretion system F family protein [Candidatus Parcubacteria bacterium]|nr:type II secretion system F family protein [Candidatus Parcubacteria bacterium]